MTTSPDPFDLMNAMIEAQRELIADVRRDWRAITIQIAEGFATQSCETARLLATVEATLRRIQAANVTQRHRN